MGKSLQIQEELHGVGLSLPYARRATFFLVQVWRASRQETLWATGESAYSLLARADCSASWLVLLLGAEDS